MAGPKIIDVQTNASGLARVLGEVAREQFPFATAQALTDLAFQAQRASKADLPHVLKLRNRYSQSGIQVNRAEKHDWPNQQAEVGIEAKRSYLVDQVLGGTREGGTHGRAILELESLRNSRGRVPKANRPARMIKKGAHERGGRTKGAKAGTHNTPKPFVLVSGKTGRELLVQRTGAARHPLQILYAFQRGVKIKREFEMDVVAQTTIAGHYDAAFRKALKRAIATAKPRD